MKERLWSPLWHLLSLLACAWVARQRFFLQGRAGWGTLPVRGQPGTGAAARVAGELGGKLGALLSSPPPSPPPGPRAALFLVLNLKLFLSAVLTLQQFVLARSGGTPGGRGLESSASPRIHEPGSIPDTREHKGLSGSFFCSRSRRLNVLLEFSPTCIWPKNKSKYEPDLVRQEERFKPDTPVTCWLLSQPLAQLLPCRPALNWVNWEQWRESTGNPQLLLVAKPLGSLSLCHGLQMMWKMEGLCLNSTPQ